MGILSGHSLQVKGNFTSHSEPQLQVLLLPGLIWVLEGDFYQPSSIGAWKVSLYGH